MSLPTTLAAALTLLAQHNEWRRGVSDDLQPTDARELGAAIDLVCEVVPGLLVALEQIEQVPGNLSDAALETRTGANDAVARGIKVTTMRAIARAARAKAGGAA